MFSNMYSLISKKNDENCVVDNMYTVFWFNKQNEFEEKEEITKPPTKQVPFLKRYSHPQRGAPFSLKGRALFIKGAPSTIYLHLSTSPNFPPQPATSADSSPSPHT